MSIFHDGLVAASAVLDDDIVDRAFFVRLGLATAAAVFGGLSLRLWPSLSGDAAGHRSIAKAFDAEIWFSIEGVVEAETSFPSPYDHGLIVQLVVDVSLRNPEGWWSAPTLSWARAHGLRISDGSGSIKLDDVPNIKGTPRQFIYGTFDDAPPMVITGLRKRYGDAVVDELRGQHVRFTIGAVPVGFDVKASCVGHHKSGEERLRVVEVVAIDQQLATSAPELRRAWIVASTLFALTTLVFIASLFADFGIVP